MRGKPLAAICRTKRARDHPRRCGENYRATFVSAGSYGSPPQVRGKLMVDKTLVQCRRITPAGAGKTLIGFMVGCSAEDHPRRCGENFIPLKPHLAAAGSPPQVRGKRICFSVRAQQTGITPAGAGKTLFMSVHTPMPQDHPRRCGENCAGCAVQRLCAGSPPQVRGKQFNTLRKTVTDGITPADAGKTEGADLTAVRAEDHPRGCGENLLCGL